MSRIGNRLLQIPENITIQVEGNFIYVASPQHKLSIPCDPALVGVEVQENIVKTLQLKQNKNSHMCQGTVNALINNAFVGLTKGFTKTLKIVGVGYKAIVKDNQVHLSLGYSHPIILDIPESITVKQVSQIELELKSFNKIELGQFAVEIRKWRKPEPYKGKGIFCDNETIIKKVGKTSEGGKK